MIVVPDASQLNAGPHPVCGAIGFFDGVHLGHQEVIRQSLREARACSGWAVAITFDSHPSTVVAPQRNPALIYPLAKRLRVFEALGLDAALVFRFDRDFSRQTGEEFIRHLVRDVGHLYSVSVGVNFVFGHHRSGNLELLQRLGTALGFLAHGREPVTLESEPVSSTRIRAFIRHGDLARASQLLGRPYSLCGVVEAGDQLGRRLGFPTANVQVGRLVLPPNGVYAARALAGGGTYGAVVNIGSRPTLRQAAPELRVEAHLLDFSGDLYRQELELAFVSRLRAERSFPTLDTLQEQIRKDIAQARSLF